MKAVMALFMFLASMAAYPAAVQLVWKPNPTDILGRQVTVPINYFVCVSQQTGTYDRTKAISAGTANTFTVNGLADGQTYYFVVYATAAGYKDSVFSNEETTSTLVPLGAPMDLNIPVSIQLQAQPVIQPENRRRKH
jgi:hypothetical protein